MKENEPDWWLWRLLMHPKLHLTLTELEAWSVDYAMECHRMLDQIEALEARK